MAKNAASLAAVLLVGAGLIGGCGGNGNTMNPAADAGTKTTGDGQGDENAIEIPLAHEFRIFLNFYTFYGNSTGAHYTPTLQALLDGTQAEAHAFGKSAATRDAAAVVTPATTTQDERVFGTPKFAPINPIYLFFDRAGRPLFSRPVRDPRTGRFWIRGGSDVTRAGALNADGTAAPSAPLEDPDRGTADYQRPIIDVLPDFDAPPERQRYSGLWQIVKVTAPEGFVPDSIQSLAAIEAQGLSLEQTDLAINCPLVDLKSTVAASNAVYEGDTVRIPQPRIELWHRARRVDCFLANGWETLGETTPDPEGQGNDGYRLYHDDEDDKRVQTFDVTTVNLGSGATEQSALVSPIGRIYVPDLSNVQDLPTIRPAYAIVPGPPPRRKPSDPPGYRPIRWVWTVNVGHIPEASAGFNLQSVFNITGRSIPLTRIDNIDASLLSPHPGSVVANWPLAGQHPTCTEVGIDTPKDQDPCRKYGLVCPWFQGNEQNVHCEEKMVRYGEICAPTLSQCRTRVDKPRMDPIQAHRIWNEGDVVESWFFESQQLPPIFNERFEAIDIPEELLMERKVLFNKSMTWITPHHTGIYGCHGDNGAGRCYLSCNGNNANLLQGQTAKLDLGDGKTVDLPLDSRCGGHHMPGYRCLPGQNDAADSGGRLCLRSCNPEMDTAISQQICRHPTPMYLSEQHLGYDLAQNTRCETVAGFAACNLPSPMDGPEGTR